jgi:hypothetical protein
MLAQSLQKKAMAMVLQALICVLLVLIMMCV